MINAVSTLHNVKLDQPRSHSFFLYMTCFGHRSSRRLWQSSSGFRTTTLSCQPTCMGALWWPTIPSTGPEILEFEGGACTRPRRTTNSLERFTIFSSFSFCFFFLMCNLWMTKEGSSEIFFVWDGSWRGLTHTPTVGCTTAGTAETSLTRASPMGPDGTLCPEVSRI